MSRNGVNRTGRSTKAPRHVRLHHWLMETSAWKSLNGNERAIYVAICARYAGENSNNGRIPFSMREAAGALRISKATAARAFAVLIERGFIVPTTRGAFRTKQRHATEWRLTEYPCDVTHKMSTKDFVHWSPKIQNTVSPQTSTVPLVRPNGISGETVTSENSPDGTSGETVAPVSADPRSHHGSTTSLPGAQGQAALSAVAVSS